MIDLRSDTVTKPTDAMRRAMAQPDFDRNLIERRFEVLELGDGLAHSGASLLALAEVLCALDAHLARNAN